jgi:hypothetical protein
MNLTPGSAENNPIAAGLSGSMLVITENFVLVRDNDQTEVFAQAETSADLQWL